MMLRYRMSQNSMASNNFGVLLSSILLVVGPSLLFTNIGVHIRYKPDSSWCFNNTYPPSMHASPSDLSTSSSIAWQGEDICELKQHVNEWSLNISTKFLQKSTLSTGVLNFEAQNTHHLLIIILLSGQVEINPGPSAPVQHPCCICHNEVTDSDYALNCVSCAFWCHINCCGMSELNYETLCNRSGSFSWICYECSCPNFSSSLFATASIETSNSFSVLNSSGDNLSDLPQVQPLTSTPTRTTNASSPKFPPPKNRRTSLKAMVINCNSLKSANKQTAFQANVNQHNLQLNLDIIFGCESKIDCSIPTYSLFTSNYTIFRKDRDANGGGVFIATRDTLVSSDLPDFDTNCEVILANFGKSSFFRF